MSRRGAIALEAVIAAGLTLVLLTVLAALFSVFWQSWHETTQANRQRQWAAMAFEYLDRDIRDAQRVTAAGSSIDIALAQGNIEYKVSSDAVSFHRREGTTYYALALVESVNCWWEGELLWVQLNFPGESYCCCYYVPEDKR